MSAEFQLFVDVWRAALNAIIILSPAVLFSLILSITIARLYARFFSKSVWPFTVLLLIFSLFGAMIGIFVGASRQPIISNTLPPIIALVSGYIVLTKSNGIPSRTRLVFPAGVLLLLLMLLIGAFYMKGVIAGEDSLKNSDDPKDSLSQ